MSAVEQCLFRFQRFIAPAIGDKCRFSVGIPLLFRRRCHTNLRSRASAALPVPSSSNLAGWETAVPHVLGGALGVLVVSPPRLVKQVGHGAGLWLSSSCVESSQTSGWGGGDREFLFRPE